MSESLKGRIDEIDARLAVLRRQREEIDHEMEILAIRLAALREAEALIREDAQKNGEEPLDRGKSPGDPPRGGLTAKWNEALADLKKKNSKFKTDDLVAQMAAISCPVERTKARTRLSDGVKRGDLIRVSEGVFEFPKEQKTPR